MQPSRWLSKLIQLTSGPSGTTSSITRYQAYRGVARAADGLASSPASRILAISGSSPLVETLGVSGEVVRADYPDHDMRALAFADASFDVVVSDQVLEHIEGDPFDAFAESARVLAPGGWLVHTTCLMNPVHRDPGDYWRYTPEALHLMADQSGLRTVHAGGWGNRWVVVLLALGRGLRRLPVPNAEWHPVHRIATVDDPLWPIITWVVAEKPHETSSTPAP